MSDLSKDACSQLSSPEEDERVRAVLRKNMANKTDLSDFRRGDPAHEQHPGA